MQIKTFHIPTVDAGAAEEELNKFLRAHRILTIEKQFVVLGQQAFWSLLVEYLPDKPKSPEVKAAAPKEDYRDVLNEADFALFCRLKEIRKAAAEDAGTPVYAIFTNRHLAEMTRRRCLTVAEVAAIPGIGESRAKKHAAPFLQLIETETKDEPAPENSGSGESSTGLSEGEPGKTGKA